MENCGSEETGEIELLMNKSTRGSLGVEEKWRVDERLVVDELVCVRALHLPVDYQSLINQ